MRKFDCIAVREGLTGLAALARTCLARGLEILCGFGHFYPFESALWEYSGEAVETFRQTTNSLPRSANARNGRCCLREGGSRKRHSGRGATASTIPLTFFPRNGGSARSVQSWELLLMVSPGPGWNHRMELPSDPK